MASRERTASTIARSLAFHREVVSGLLLRGWQHLGEARLSFPVAEHPAIEVAWFEGTGGDYRIGRGPEVAVGEGQVMLVPPRTEHRSAILPSTRAHSVHLGEALVAEVADAMGQAGRVAAGPVALSSRILALGRLLIDELAEPGPGQILAADALGEALVVEVLRRQPAARPHGQRPEGERAGGERPKGGRPRDARLRVALDAVESRFAEPLTVDDLARAARMSRYHFTRLFRAELGQSPYRYLVETRLQRAAELLRRGSHNVTDAALSVGFNDLSRFSRYFRRRFGVSPSAMQKHAAKARWDPGRGRAATSSAG